MAQRKAARQRTTISDRLDVLNDTLTAQHLDVCQRLTKLETALTAVPERVSLLEQMKYKLIGALTVLSASISLLVSWLHRK